MKPLTVLAIQNLKPSDTYQKIQVSKGLFVGVKPNGDKTFFVRYSVSGKQTEYRLPKLFGRASTESTTSLADAILLTAQIVALGKEGICYKQKLIDDQKAARERTEVLTVSDLYNTWFPTTRRKDGGVELTRYFKTILAAIGSISLNDINEGHIKQLLTSFSDAGHNRKAVMHLNALKQMFKWGEGRKPWKLLFDNPVVNLKPLDITQTTYKEVERDRALKPDEIRELLLKIKHDAQLVIQSEIALLLYLSCTTRGGETVKAKWDNVDLENGVWFIPESDTKGKAPAHTVYLSDFAIRQFKRLKSYNLHTIFCFPDATGKAPVDVRTITKQVAARQLQFKDRKTPLSPHLSTLSSSLVVSGGEWVPHDLRRSSASLMQSLGVDRYVIERALNHVEENRMQRIYQRHDYKAELKDAWAKVGEALSSYGV